jgi:EAL and modified HD-GYP domain-containing signal transduction protein
MEPAETMEQRHPDTPECFLGRQPIYDGNREIRAYELLYRRNAADRTANFTSGDEASATVLLRAFIEIGLSKVSQDQPVFINHTASLLAMDPIVPPDRCVIEVLEDVEVNSVTIACLERLKGLGYRIALDDFVYSETRVPFLRLAHYVKLDLRGLPGAELGRHVEILKPFGVRIIAEKIESAEEFESSRALGCDLFQGYYLRKPEVLRGRRIPANKMSALALMVECTNPDQSAASIAAILSRDASLVYGLLRLANSALYGSQVRIRGPVMAVSMLGVDRVFRWASLLVLSGCNDSPLGYLGIALQRARSCELIAEACGSKPQLAYMAGLLSTLDCILNAPLADVIAPLPLETEFKRSVLQHEGELGAILNAALSYESGSFDPAAQNAFSIDTVQAAYWDAVAYSASMMGRLKAARDNSAR